ncbi:MAG: RdgB/HAM1 family non-canonical purine NTP pyrophosphatase [Clostridia bacterium]|nr:RdgB/HAM1 family non-canonical purine NTP pyrophosphatase [Clostridia bacterium]
MEKLVVATSNVGKLKEFKEMLGDKYAVISMAEAGFVGDVDETGETFYDNALLKAQTVSRALGVAALADDSGLEVACLGGAPGVYSARYSGEPCDNARNRALLLENMKGAEDRSARFVSCIVLYKPSGEVVSALGTVEGEILKEEQGNNGFGYDCLFFSTDLNKCFGVATDEEKNSVSHRGRALRALLEKL